VHKRYLITIAAVGTAGALALAACSSSSKSSSGGGGLGGGGSSSAAGGGGNYKIGFQGPLSGDNAQLGINEYNAVVLAVQQANQSNSFGFKVTLVKSDDVGDPSKAPAAATTLQQDPAILGVIGPAFSGPTKAVGASYDAAHLVLISGSATNPTLSSLGFKSFHRVVAPDSLEGKEAADWLAKKSPKSVFVVDDLTDYGKGAADAVEAELKVKGVSVTRQGVAQKTTDYSVIAQKVKASGAGALFYGGYDAQAALFAKALKTAGYTGVTMSGNGGKSSKFTEGSGDAGNGWYFSCGCLDATVAPQAKAFNDAYTKMFNTPPSTYSPEAYDAANALLTAIKDAGSSGTATRQSVWDAVNKLDYKGITTQIKFQPNGEVEAQVINLYLQKNGKIGLVGNITSAS
jgi:branched-chain amino acid transport system substrate-binding protein